MQNRSGKQKFFCGLAYLLALTALGALSLVARDIKIVEGQLEVARLLNDPSESLPLEDAQVSDDRRLTVAEAGVLAEGERLHWIQVIAVDAVAVVSITFAIVASWLGRQSKVERLALLVLVLASIAVFSYQYANRDVIDLMTELLD